jgi:hypothetical protein
VIRRGEVEGVRELSGSQGHRIQARVCLGASARLGSAIVTIESKSPEVLVALDALKKALADDAMNITKAMFEEGSAWANDGKPHTSVEVKAS